MSSQKDLLGNETDHKTSGSAGSKGKTGISDAEWQVMSLLWEESPLTSFRIVERLRDSTEWNPRTIKTMLSRLVKKGFLDYEVEANRYLYSPTIDRKESVREESRSFLQRVFQGDAGSMLLHFVKSTELSAQERERLRDLLDQMEDKA